MTSEYKNSIVIISDSNYVIPTYILIISLLYHKIDANIVVLGVNLTESEVYIFEQFDNVSVHKGDTSNKRNAATRKAEAILAANKAGVESISLFDADCIVTGNISRYLDKDLKGLSARFKDQQEDGMVFSSRYDNNDVYGSIPKAVLARWKADVGERGEPAIRNTVCGGNLTIKSDQIDFVQKWHDQMMKVLDNEDATKLAHDKRSLAYSQLDESVLNSLLAFSYDAPILSHGWFNKDPKATLIHLGPCNPRYWKYWRLDRVKYYQNVIELIDWSQKKGFISPKIPWSLNKKFKIPVHIMAYISETVPLSKKVIKSALKAIPFSK